MAKHLARVKEEALKKTHVSGWVLEKEDSSYAPANVHSNKDLDPTPLEQRTWTGWTIFGYWFSDIISVQSWETGSSILALGLTWREAIFSIIFGSFVMGLPMSLNGYAGAKTHVAFPVLARSGFGYHFAKFPVVIRLITVCFWHAITNYLAMAPMFQVIRSIWPSFRTMHNSLPADADITSAQLIAYFLVFLVQIPILMIHPSRMKWLFTAKLIMCVGTIVGMTIWICVKTGGGGDIWNQKATVGGSTKAWLIMWSLNSCTSSWSTVGVNIADFTRYMKKPKPAFTQAIFFPVICSWVAILGIVVASASYERYGTYVWDPIDIIDSWDGSAGRAAAFFAGLSWLLAQVCVNVSATVISGANDLTNLFPKYFNIRRGALTITIISSWALVPWKILSSANSLLQFMNSLGIFLAPTMGILIADFFAVKRMHLDVPALYQPHGRYRYHYGVNWRAVVAFVCSLGPTLPGLAYNVNNNLHIGGAMYVANFNWYYGIITPAVIFIILSYVWPAKETLVPYMIESLEDGAERKSQSSQELAQERLKGPFKTDF